MNTLENFVLFGVLLIVGSVLLSIADSWLVNFSIARERKKYTQFTTEKWRTTSIPQKLSQKSVLRKIFGILILVLFASSAAKAQCTLSDGSPCTGSIAVGQIATTTPMYLQFSDPDQNLLVAETSAQQNFSHASGFMTIQFSDSNLLTDTVIEVQYKNTAGGPPWITTLTCSLRVSNGLQIGTFCAGNSPPSSSDAAFVITSPTNNTVGGLSWVISFYSASGQNFWTIEDADPFMEQNYVVPITTPSYGADANCSDALPCAQPLWLEFNTQGTTTDALNETVPSIPILGTQSDNLMSVSDMLDQYVSPVTGGIKGNPQFEGPLQNQGNYGFRFSPGADGFGFNWSSPNPLSMGPPSQISSTQAYADGIITSPFTVYLNESVSGSWSGTFDDGGTPFSSGVGSSSLDLQVLPNFSIVGEIDLAPNSLCLGSPELVLSLTDAQAVAKGVDSNDGISSIQVGDIGEISASDSVNTVWFIMTSIEDNGNFLGAGQKFITGFSLPTNSVCPGAAFFDRPFEVETKSAVRAIGPRRVRMPRFERFEPQPQSSRHHHVGRFESKIRAAIAEHQAATTEQKRNEPSTSGQQELRLQEQAAEGGAGNNSIVARLLRNEGRGTRNPSPFKFSLEILKHQQHDMPADSTVNRHYSALGQQEIDRQTLHDWRQ